MNDLNDFRKMLVTVMTAAFCIFILVVFTMVMFFVASCNTITISATNTHGKDQDTGENIVKEDVTPTTDLTLTPAKL
jgi:uncharacterized membrane protein